MIRGFSRETGNFGIQLRHPRDSIVSGPPKVRTVQIMENLRSALDYIVFELSAKNNPALTRNQTQFVITDSEEAFDKQSKRMLQYLNEEQRAFVESLQPYRGNHLIAILRDATNSSKHRGLLSVRDCSALEIVFAESAKRDQYREWWMYPLEKEHAVFARSTGLRIVLIEKYDALAILQAMLNHTWDVFAAFSRNLIGGRSFPKIAGASGS